MSALDLALAPSRIQLVCAYKLANAFGHWWAGCARLAIVGPAPAVRFGEAEEEDDREAHSEWALRYNAVTAFQVADRFGGMNWEEINDACAAADDDDRDSHWSGGVNAAPTHTTQSGTVRWVVAPDGTVTVTGYRRGNVAGYDADGNPIRVGGPDSPAWWTATVHPDGATTVIAHEGAPTGPGDQWEEDHGIEAPQLGEYTWGVLGRAVAALGGNLPSVPPAPELLEAQYAPCHPCRGCYECTGEVDHEEEAAVGDEE